METRRIHKYIFVHTHHHLLFVNVSLQLLMLLKLIGCASIGMYGIQIQSTSKAAVDLSFSPCMVVGDLGGGEYYLFN